MYQLDYPGRGGRSMLWIRSAMFGEQNVFIRRRRSQSQQRQLYRSELAVWQLSSILRLWYEYLTYLEDS
jgi:hypothetical protein